MDTTNVIISDSLQVYNTINQILPGIAPGIAALLAAWISTRYLFIFKLLVTWFPKLMGIPEVNVAVSTIKGLWARIAWIVNPVVMAYLGYLATGKWDLGVLVGFAGIGVREWLIKSPIPTSREELKKVTGMMVLVMGVTLATSASAGNMADARELAAAALELPSNRVQVVVLPPTNSKPGLFDNIGYAVGGGFVYDKWSLNEGFFPWLGLKGTKLLSGRLGIQAEGKRVFSEDPHYQISTGFWFNF